MYKKDINTHQFVIIIFVFLIISTLIINLIDSIQQIIILIIFILIITIIDSYLFYKRRRKLVNRVIEAIKRFKPFRKYNYEDIYQIDLARYLKFYFPSTKIEIQRGSSRPDIIIGNIAIEVKGPTTSDDLKTISDKCVRYHQYFNKLIIVMFDMNVSSRFYNDLKNGLKKHFPKVILIKKS